MIAFYGLVTLGIGGALILMGALGIWLAMNSPIQMQPIPFILLVLGLLIAILGLVILFATS